tara:strand:- start:388 stop:918 length:531 start_codon:yes stop_codon:yes gene_type:complete
MRLTKEKLYKLIKEELETTTEGNNRFMDYAVGMTWQIATAVSILAGMYGIPKHLYNEKKDILVDELNDMSAIEIENKLERELPDSFKETLKKQGTNVSELSIKIEQMNPDQIGQTLEMKIQYEIDFDDEAGRHMPKGPRNAAKMKHSKGEPIQSRPYDLSDPLVAPGYYPPFKYDK